MNNKQIARKRRHARIKKKLQGTSDRPRLCVFKSNKNMYAQLVDDVNARTILSVSTLNTEIKGNGAKNAKNIKNAALLAELLVKKLQEKGIKTLVFDRSGYVYHGKVKVFADTLRKGGFVF